MMKFCLKWYLVNCWTKYSSKLATVSIVYETNELGTKQWTSNHLADMDAFHGVGMSL